MDEELRKLYQEERGKLSQFPDADDDFIALDRAYKRYYQNKNFHNLTWQDVFDSQKMFPKDFDECRQIAKSVQYSFIAFNGNVYSVLEYDISKPTCSIKDLK